jgi:hypothetical protein
MANGWELAMTLVPLPGGGVLVHSPTWLGDDTFARVLAVGEPRVLFAPNHFHHLSLSRFQQRWPHAKVVAGRDAIAGLHGRKHGYARSLASAEVAADLPQHARFLECDGTRAGETFLSLRDSPDDRPTWLVCDAFFHVTRPVTGPAGIALRATLATPGLAIGWTFRTFVLRDRAVYKAWLLSTIEEEQPRALWMSHGDALVADDLPARLSALVRDRV